MSIRHGIAVLALGCSAACWANEGHGDRPHSHWWLDMGLTPSWYAGGSLGRSDFSNWSSAAKLDSGSYTSRAEDYGDTGLRVFTGVDFSRYFALELGYTDFGEATFRGQSDGSGFIWSAGPVSESVALEAFELNLIGKLPVSGDLALFGRVGTISAKSNQRITATSQCCGPESVEGNSRDTDLTYGAGLEYDGFRPVRLVAAYGDASFDVALPVDNSTAHVKSFALSLAYLF
jgi:hypothetical protein